MSWLLNFIGNLIVLIVFLLVVMALLSPFEALGWWAGWSKQHAPRRTDTAGAALAGGKAPARHDAALFLVYLTGILGFEGGTGGRRESDLVARIAARLPAGAVVIDDVFPYSVTNNPLNGERLFARSWDWINRRRLKKRNLVNVYSALIVARNLFQVAVSADPRYGPISNLGVAREIARSLIRHGYVPGSGKPIYLVGYSGGGQIAVGAARYLREAFDAPIHVIGLGGVYTDDPGVAALDRLTDLRGSKDFVPSVGTVLYPGRWPLLRYSPWNRARRAGRIVYVESGPMTHFGKYDYFGRSAKFPDGVCYADRTAELAAQAIRETVGQPLLISPSPPAPPAGLQ
jgi:hypothetical protein